ncbi:MAG: O-sialoglycoprotein endopeptidase [Selenomonadales bacterium]|nr:O-sialoglycoprotein endopeptidase [Selenomonadales bacterium]
MKGYVGIDTSCYTTSVAIIDEAGDRIADNRRILSVKEGKRGLAQSEMVFQHMRNLPELWEGALGSISGIRIAGIGVSTMPRRAEGSYMPAFLAGHGYARVLSAALDVPIYGISHQEGHIYAGLWSCRQLASDDFLAMHVSGGTTELVRVRRDGDIIRSVELLGGSCDLHGGQFVDRIGVALGLSFPTGKKLEELAKSGHDDAVELPVSVRGLTVSFAGPESHAQRLMTKPYDKAAMAAGVEECIAKTLARLLRNAVQETGCRDILMVGGVMSNTYIRNYLKVYFAKKRIHAKLHYPEAVYSPDNAMGAAYAAWLMRGENRT